MIHVKYKLDTSGIHGVGLFADEDIKKGGLVYTSSPLLDLNLTQEQFESLTHQEQKEVRWWGFLDTVSGLWHVDFDVSKFINHSSDGNVTQDSTHADAYLVAVRDIQKGEELTQNYLEFESESDLRARGISIQLCKDDPISFRGQLVHMVTKFVLHGGITKADNTDNGAFFAEMGAGLQGRVIVLLNYFSRSDDEVLECAAEDKKCFEKNNPDADLQFEIADQATMAVQCKRANIIYFRGGNTIQLIQRMLEITDVRRCLEGKVVGGSSAGAYLLSKYYWESEGETLGMGLGILPIKTVCHFTLGREDRVKRLLEHQEQLPVVVLPEFKWVTIYQ